MYCKFNTNNNIYKLHSSAQPGSMSGFQSVYKTSYSYRKLLYPNIYVHPINLAAKILIIQTLTTTG